MKLILQDKRQETPSVYSFLFKPTETINFTAGQFIRLIVPHENPDSRGIKRSFSIASSPTEDFLMVTTRFIDGGSSFKKALLALLVGSSIEAEGPYGSFVLPNDSSPCIFITGGVGITPVRSILKYATDKRLVNQLTLLYSNRTGEEIAHQEFLDKLPTQNPNLEITYALTRLEPTANLKNNHNWRAGRIDKQLIKEQIKDGERTLFYLSGPMTMVADFYSLLKEMGIEDSRIKRENFPGY